MTNCETHAPGVWNDIKSQDIKYWDKKWKSFLVFFFESKLLFHLEGRVEQIDFWYLFYDPYSTSQLAS